MEEEIKKQKFNYKIQQLNDTDFVLYLTYEYDSGLMLNTLMNIMEKNKAKEMLENVQEFNIPDKVKGQYCWAMHKAILSNIATVRKILLKEDKVDLLNHKCTDVKYIKLSKDKWKCEVEILGTMLRR